MYFYLKRNTGKDGLEGRYGESEAAVEFQIQCHCLLWHVGSPTIFFCHIPPNVNSNMKYIKLFGGFFHMQDGEGERFTFCFILLLHDLLPIYFL